ncbi:protein rep [Lactobacillaceae bacterium Melli_B3]
MSKKYEILRDVTKSGKEINWKDKKIKSIKYAGLLSESNPKKAENVATCGDFLEFAVDANGNKKLAHAWFCKSRLCAMCSWRLAMKNSHQLIRVLEEAYKQVPNGRFLFLTLTSKNSDDAEDLRDNLHQMGRAVSKLFQYKKVKKNLIGYVRSTEVTVNKDNLSFHQHMHVILFVKPNYFNGKENYITHKDWTKYWQRALKLDYPPMVNIEIVKSRSKFKSKSSLIDSAKETAKYQVKSADYLNHSHDENSDIVKALEYALYGSRAISYGGLLKSIRHDLKLEDEDNLVDTDSDDDSIEDAVGTVFAVWDTARKNYFIENEN